MGVAAATGLTLYFLGALGFHVGARDAKGLPMPTVFLVLSVLALVIRLFRIRNG